jgi:hypothetical protein
MAMTIVAKTTRNDESRAKPAPGPMYAWAGSAAATSPTVRASRTQVRWSFFKDSDLF